MASNPLTSAEQALVSQAWERADSITAHLDGLMAATPRDEEDAPYDKYIPINQKRVKRIRKALAKKGFVRSWPRWPPPCRTAPGCWC